MFQLGALIQGRAKGVVQPVTRNYVIETLTLSNGRKLEYKQVSVPFLVFIHSLSFNRYWQVEGVFSNPNARGNVATLDFLTSCAQEIVTEHKAGVSNSSSLLSFHAFKLATAIHCGSHCLHCFCLNPLFTPCCYFLSNIVVHVFPAYVSCTPACTPPVSTRAVFIVGAVLWEREPQHRACHRVLLHHGR